MSASLVGSEMCIRDSLFVGWQPGGRSEARARGRWQWPGRAEEGRQRHEVCLLYTSDAADDM
eukprot:12832913-Alexandrium_andersonii.AAC.1